MTTLYHFDLIHEGVTSRDDVGTELQGDEEAVEQAAHAIAEVLMDGPASIVDLTYVVRRQTLVVAMVTLSVFCVGTGRWRLKVRPVPEKARTAEVVAHLETAMRDRLTDVFWFHDRWRIDKVRPLCFYTKQAPTEAARAAT